MILAKKFKKNPNIAKIFQIFAQNNPEPSGELEYTNIYTLLVAVTLSAQATDISVNKATKSLFQVINTPHDMIKLGYDGLIPYIRTIGLYQTKAKNLIAAAIRLVEVYQGIVPDNLADLTSLAGVGTKTARVVCNIGFGKPEIAVDTHIQRLSARLALTDSQNPDKISADLMKIIPQEYLLHAHHWLILHGRYICKAQKPQCASCPISEFCPSKMEYTQ